MNRFSWSYIASYAQSNEPLRVGTLCMWVLDRTKKVCPRTLEPVIG